MLSEFSAPEIQFSGLGASGSTAAEAAERLAVLLRQWTAAHQGCRILQLSVLPAVAGASPATAAESFGAMALVAYTETGLTSEDAAEAVAAAVEEIRDAQTGTDEPEDP